MLTCNKFLTFAILALSSQALIAERKVLPVFEIKDLAELKVTVVPKSLELEPITRGATQRQFQIDIGVQKKITGDADTQATDLIMLVDEMVSYLQKRSLDTKPAAVWVKSTNEPVYDRVHLSQERVFTSLITVSYRIVS